MLLNILTHFAGTPRPHFENHCSNVINTIMILIVVNYYYLGMLFCSVVIFQVQAGFLQVLHGEVHAKYQ